MADQGPALAPVTGFPAWLGELLAGHAISCTFANDTPAPPGWRLDGRCIDEGHMVLVPSGRAWYRLDDRELELGAGTMVAVAPGVPHDAWPDRAHWPHLLTARFACHRRGDGRAVARPSRPFAVRIELRDPGRVAAIMRELRRRYLEGEGALRQALRDALLVQALALIAEDAGAAPADAAIEAVRRRLLQQPERRTSVDELARAAGLSRKHFLRRFRRATGSSPIAFAIAARCRRAQELLAEDGATVAQVAAALGYPDPFGFSRQFARVVGRPPSACRRR